MAANDGGPAFPSHEGQEADGCWDKTWRPGMSLRDWFAGQLASGLAARVGIKLCPADIRLVYNMADFAILIRELELGDAYATEEDPDVPDLLEEGTVPDTVVEGRELREKYDNDQETAEAERFTDDDGKDGA